jgi:hypothetical protein
MVTILEHPPKATRAWALGKNILFLTRLHIIKALQGGARSSPSKSLNNINYLVLG